MNDIALSDLKTEVFFKELSTIAKNEIIKTEYPWQIIPKIKEIIFSLIPTLPNSFNEIKEGVWVESGAEIAKSAEIIAPCIICKSQIRTGAYLRGRVIVGRGCVVGNSTEIKNAILFDGAKCPHYNYVGDSVLGYKAHMGAGAIISNQKSDKSRVFISLSSSKIDTGLDKIVIEEASKGKPIMGIFLGMQLLFEKSYEYGEHTGLGLLKGSIVPMEGYIPKELKIPHIGYNPLIFKRESPLFKYIKEGDCVYFVHSYFAKDCEDSLMATAEYGKELTAVVGQKNIMGCQFHPEKSGDVGLKILKAFCEMETEK